MSEDASQGDSNDGLTEELFDKLQMAMVRWFPDPLVQVGDAAEALKQAALTECIDWESAPKTDAEAFALIERAKAWAKRVDDLYGRVFLFGSSEAKTASDYHAITSGGLIGTFGADWFSSLWAAVCGGSLKELEDYIAGRSNWQPAAMLLGELPSTLLTGSGIKAFHQIQDPEWVVRYLQDVPKFNESPDAYVEWAIRNAPNLERAKQEIKEHPAKHWHLVSDMHYLAYLCVRTRALRLVRYAEDALKHFLDARYPTIRIEERHKAARRVVRVELAGLKSEVTLRDHECEFLLGLRDCNAYPFDKTKLRGFCRQIPGLDGLIKSSGTKATEGFYRKNRLAHKGTNSVMYSIDTEMKTRIHGVRLDDAEK